MSKSFVLGLLFLWGITGNADAGDIHDAVVAGDLARVNEMIVANPELVHQRDSLQRTPAHWAARNGDAEILTLLIEKGADVNCIDQNGVTPLHSASARGFGDMVRLLIANGAGINARLSTGDTPLQGAIMRGQVPTARLLIELGADVNTVNEMQRTPMMAASALGIAGLVKTLIDNGANVNAKDSDGNEALTYASGSGFADVVELLLESGADPTLKDKGNDTPLHAASFSGSAIVARLLIARGVDPDVENNTKTRPIHKASEQGNIEFVHALIQAGAHVNPEDSLGMTPLHLAAKNGHLEIARMLLDTGADPDISNNAGMTPLTMALDNNHAEVADLLQPGKAGTTGVQDQDDLNRHQIIEVASSRRQWTGVAVSRDGRVFVNYPRWSPETTLSVAEVLGSGQIRPYPNEEINHWDPMAGTGDHFVCVQSVVCDGRGYLWILDTGNPYLQGVLEGGAKLVKVDMKTDRIERVYVFDSTTASPGSYLNDVRIDGQARFAYLTDSNLGAIIVLDLNTGQSRRVLDDHPSTSAENVEVRVNGQVLTYYDGSPFVVHSDGIALSRDNEYLYYQALTGHTIYRIPTGYLQDGSIDADILGQQVEIFVKGGLCDGMAFDRQGNLYLSAIEENAIKRVRPDGQIETLARDFRISWPDSFSITPDGTVYFTTSRVHEAGMFKEECKVYKLVEKS